MLNIKGGSAYKIEYNGPRGRCPDAVVTFKSTGLNGSDDITSLVSEAKKFLVDARGGEWSNHDVTVLSMSYLGPWFYYANVK